MLYVIRDWLPFALVLVAYDLTRGAADLIGRPTMWHWQVNADRWLFFGTDADGLAAGTHQAVESAVVGSRPQHRLHVVLRAPVCSGRCAVAARPRRVEGVRQAVRRAVLRGAGHLRTSARGAAVGRLPAAPPPMSRAARPVRAACSGRRAAFPTAACSARCRPRQDGANGWIERIVGRGWGKLNLHTASALLDQGQASVNLVAAVPSLHAGMTLAISVFLWKRVQPRLAAGSGRLRDHHGVHAGVHGRAFRHRHSAGMGAGRGRDVRDGVVQVASGETAAGRGGDSTERGRNFVM